MTTQPNITAEQDRALTLLIGRFIDSLIENHGDIETATRKLHTFNAAVTA